MVSPVAVVKEGAKLSGLRLQRLLMQGEGREAELLPVAGSELILECDMAIKALGQNPLIDLVKSVEGLAAERGRIIVDPETGATRVLGLFAGGDCVNGGAEVVDAVQGGRIAAHGIGLHLETE